MVRAAIKRSSMNVEQLPEIGFLRLPEVLAIIPVSRSTWLAGVRKGVYPEGRKLSPGCTAWSVADIRALVARINDKNR